MEIRFKLKDLYSNTMLNHHLSQNLKLIENDKFNRPSNTRKHIHLLYG
jgi:hypothetical protein